jgi:hypothetical protein
MCALRESEIDPPSTEMPCGSFFFYGKARLGPGSPAAVHGNAIRVAHFQQVIRGQGGPKTSAAIEDQRCGLVGNRDFDVGFDDALAKMNRPRQVAARPFVVFADGHQREFLIDVSFHGAFSIRCGVNLLSLANSEVHVLSTSVEVYCLQEESQAQQRRIVCISTLWPYA